MLTYVRKIVLLITRTVSLCFVSLLLLYSFFFFSINQSARSKKVVGREKRDDLCYLFKYTYRQELSADSFRLLTYPLLNLQIHCMII